jgi:isocitrate/isopropylmalate dehydrogenase
VLRRVALLPGDGAAAEAVLAARSVLDALDVGVEWVEPVVGSGAAANGELALPDETRRVLDATEAALFGAAAETSLPVLLYLRWGRRTFANVRPCRPLRGAHGTAARPEPIDVVLVRENLEDVYVGAEGDLRELAPLGLRARLAGRRVDALGEGRYAVKIVTEAGSERVARAAFELARRRREQGGLGLVTCGTKANVLPESDGLFLQVAERVAAEFGDCGFESVHADEAARRLVMEPERLDVVLVPNLYGDLLSGVVTGLMGGPGVAPSGCYGTDFAYFEPVHGAALDLAGRGVVNPTATLLSAAMLLEHLGFGEASERLERAVRAVYAEETALTPDQGGSATTAEVCAAVADRLEVWV